MHILLKKLKFVYVNVLYLVKNASDDDDDNDGNTKSPISLI